MSEPKVAATVPKVMELEAGTYYWCTCGQSANQPFCDGSHAGTDFTPMAFELTEGKRCALCQCKKTAKGPFCDGAHKHIGFMDTLPK
jgi:CDGSH iron-sulfur domain-containing protein 3